MTDYNSLFSKLQKQSEEVVHEGDTLADEIRKFESHVAKLHLPFEVVFALSGQEYIRWNADTASFFFYIGEKTTGHLRTASIPRRRKAISHFGDILEMISDKYTEHLNRGKPNVQTTSKPRTTTDDSKQEKSIGPDVVLQKSNSVRTAKAPKRRKANKNRTNRVKPNTKVDAVRPD